MFYKQYNAKKLTGNHKIINLFDVCWNWRQGSGVALRNLISLHMDGNPITQMYLRYILFVYLLTSTSLYAYSTLSGYREIYRIRSYTAWLTACFPVWSSHGEIVLGMIKRTWNARCPWRTSYSHNALRGVCGLFALWIKVSSNCEEIANVRTENNTF